MRRFGLVALLAAFIYPSRATPHASQIGIFAGGCFWCIEAAFNGERGVAAAETGYIGGTLENPSEGEVAAQTTGHFEAVRITFDPAVVSYRSLLVRYWLTIDPTDPGGQFCERGPSKRTAVFVLSEAQAQDAAQIRARAAAALGQPVATMIRPAGRFWLADAYHQDYARRNPQRYDFYQRACGREPGLQRIWGADPGLSADP